MKKIRPKYNHVQINIKYLLITGFYDTLESERISSLSKINQSKECKIIMLTLNKKTLSIVLATCMLAVSTVGCNSSTSEKSNSSVSTDSTGKEQEASSVAESVDSSVLHTLTNNGEKVKLSIWKPTHTTIGTRIEDWSGADYFK